MASLPLRAEPTPVQDHANTAQTWRNCSESGWVVQKFGGTSVGKFAIDIAEEIVRYVLFLRVILLWKVWEGYGWRAEGSGTQSNYGFRKTLKRVDILTEVIIRAGLEDNKIAVVCSARSTGKKVEGTTSR